ncbi:MAG TPA: M28 family metallopeptidase [Terriglobales bacterium]|nr:M28 family metallopeptidase [Terriglobales bacterium]
MRVLAFLLLAALSAAAQIAGFTPQSAKKQQQAESKLIQSISSDQIKAYHRIFTAEPHPAGSERNNELARYIAEEWKKQGLEDVAIRQYDVLNTMVRDVSLEMVAPVRYKASLREDAYDVDPDTKNPNVSPGWIGLSQSGEVTAPVVYANGGNPEDYAVLREAGIDVKDKIVLVRYSNPYSYRGFKALTAQQNGAAAILIYSDPQEDGFKKGAVFPEGPWGPESHIQRGAITYDFIVPGDPLTPGWASVPGAKQIPAEKSETIPRIVALPLSWRDAKPLLENMDGPVAPKAWQGGLPITYKLGGSRVRAHLKVLMDNSVKPNYVVEGRIRGSDYPDQWIVLGNHRDAWVYGGVDPSSGTASMMDLTRVLGDMLKQGTRPRRTLVFCSWDGEEVGLTGSTEWGEQFADELKQKAVAYLNVDSSASGPDLNASAVASLAPMLVESTKVLRDPSGSTLYEAAKASMRRAKAEGPKGGWSPGSDDKTATIADSDLVDTRIGSGSDHTVFLNHLGIPVIGLTFDGPYGVYHSMYDDFYWINNIGDPGYRYHTLLSQLWGTVALRLANADVLPLDFAIYAVNLRQFVSDLRNNTKVDKSKAASDLDRLNTRISAFENAGMNVNHAISSALNSGKLDSPALDRINRGLMQVEGNWLNPDGIPGRPWFKHMLYAARYTYDHLELPAITEAVEAGRFEVAKRQIALLEQALEKNTTLLNQLATQLKQTAAQANEGKPAEHKQ